MNIYEYLTGYTAKSGWKCFLIVAGNLQRAAILSGGGWGGGVVVEEDEVD